MATNQSDALSLPECRKRVNTHPRDVRIEARRLVMCDNRLSFGTRCLYFLIDDYGWTGRTYVSQLTLAGRLNVSERQIRAFVAELRQAGYITLRRSRRTEAEFRLFWADQDRQDTSGQGGGNTLRPEARPEESFQMHLMETGRNRECALCGGTGRRRYRSPNGGARIGAREWEGPCGCQD